MNGEDKEYYYETKAVVLQYLGLVPGALSNTAYTQLDHSTSSSIRAINQSSRSVSEEELASLRSSLDTNDLEQLGFSEGLPVLQCQGDGINRNDGRKSDNIGVGPPQDSGVQGHYPRLHFSTSVSVESFASNNTSLVSKHNWLSSDDLLSDTARERHCIPSREELTQGVQSDGLTHLMAFSPRRHALSDPPDSSMLLHQRPLADRSNLQLQLTSTPPSSEQSMYTPRHRSNRSNDVDRSTYLQYLQNEYDEVQRHSETPTSNNVSDSPEAEVARMLEAISREVMRTHGKCVTQATNQVLKENLVQLTYEDFREAADGLVQTAPPGIHRISLALCFSRQLASALLLRGSQSMRDVTEYSVQFVANTAANFIVDRGGWTSITDLEFQSSPELSFPPTPSSQFPFTPQEEPFYVMPHNTKEMFNATCTSASEIHECRRCNQTLIKEGELVNMYCYADSNTLYCDGRTYLENSHNEIEQYTSCHNNTLDESLNSAGSADLIDDYHQVLDSYFNTTTLIVSVLALSLCLAYTLFKRSP